jgi:hypothetical protein
VVIALLGFLTSPAFSMELLMIEKPFHVFDDSIGTKPPVTKVGRIGFYADYLNIAGQLFGNNQKYEGGAHFMFLKNIFLTVEAGTANLQPKSSIINGEYRADGHFWKAGLDFIVSHNRESDSKIYIGGRYARASFFDKGHYVVESSMWPSYRASFFREDLRADWYELLLGTEGNIFSGFYTGWMIRYRILADSPRLFPIPVYNIPGFGTGSGKNTFAFNLYLKYMIRW